MRLLLISFLLLVLSAISTIARAQTQSEPILRFAYVALIQDDLGGTTRADLVTVNARSGAIERTRQIRIPTSFGIGFYTSISTSPDGQWLAVLFNAPGAYETERTVRLYNLVTDEVRDLGSAADYYSDAARWSFDSRYVAFIDNTSDNGIYVHDVLENEAFNLLTDEPGYVHAFVNLTWATKTNHLAVYMEECEYYEPANCRITYGSVNVYDVWTRHRIDSFDLLNTGIRWSIPPCQLDFSPDARYLAITTACPDVPDVLEDVYLWEIGRESLQVITRFTAPYFGAPNSWVLGSNYSTHWQDNDTLVIRANYGRTGIPQTHLLQYTPSTDTRTLLNEPAPPAEPPITDVLQGSAPVRTRCNFDWSPDRTLLAYAIYSYYVPDPQYSNPGAWDCTLPQHALMMYDPTQGNSYRVDTADYDVYKLVGWVAPAESAPPEQIVFSREYEFEGQTRTRLMIMNEDGTNVRALGAWVGNAAEPTCSPDGLYVAYANNFTSAPRLGGSMLEIMTARAEERRPLIGHENAAHAPAFSPDGSQIVYANGNRFHVDIEIAGVTVFGQTPLVDVSSLETNPTWSGNQIGFEAHLRTSAGDNAEIYAINTDGSALVNLTRHPAMDTDPAWNSTYSRSGQNIVFVSDRDGNSELYVIDAVERDVTRLTDYPGFDGMPAWSSDGRRGLFVSDRDGNREIYALSLEDNSIQRLTHYPGADSEPCWLPHPRRY